MRGAVALNMLDMIGVGPFITLPLILGAMGGPQAMLGWVLGAGLAVCDGLVWAELGAAMPEAGGTYAFLRRIICAECSDRRVASRDARHSLRPSGAKRRQRWAGEVSGIFVCVSGDVFGAAVGGFGVHWVEPVCGVSVAGLAGHTVGRVMHVGGYSVG